MRFRDRLKYSRTREMSALRSSTLTVSATGLRLSSGFLPVGAD